MNNKTFYKWKHWFIDLIYQPYLLKRLTFLSNYKQQKSVDQFSKCGTKKGHLYLINCFHLLRMWSWTNGKKIFAWSQTIPPFGSDIINWVSSRLWTVFLSNWQKAEKKVFNRESLKKEKFNNPLVPVTFRCRKHLNSLTVYAINVNQLIVTQRKAPFHISFSPISNTLLMLGVA